MHAFVPAAIHRHHRRALVRSASAPPPPTPGGLANTMPAPHAREDGSGSQSASRAPTRAEAPADDELRSTLRPQPASATAGERFPTSSALTRCQIAGASRDARSETSLDTRPVPQLIPGHSLL